MGVLESSGPQLSEKPLTFSQGRIYGVKNTKNQVGKDKRDTL